MAVRSDLQKYQPLLLEQIFQLLFFACQLNLARDTSLAIQDLLSLAIFLFPTLLKQKKHSQSLQLETPTYSYSFKLHFFSRLYVADSIGYKYGFSSTCLKLI